MKMKCEYCKGSGLRTIWSLVGEPMEEADCPNCEGTGVDLRVKEAIAAAVLAERRRVWDALSDEIADHDWTDDAWDGLTLARAFLFPDGEP